MSEMRLPRYRWVLLLGMFLPMIVFATMEYMAPTPIAKIIEEELGIAEWQMGLIVGIVGLILALFQFFTGLVVDRLGAKNTITLSLTLMGVGGCLSAFSPDFYTLLLSRLIFAIGNVLHMPAISPIIMTWFSVDEYGKAQTVPSVSPSLGIALTMAFVPSYLITMGWRNVLLLFAIILLILDIIWFFAGRDPLFKREPSKLPSLTKLKNHQGKKCLALWSSYVRRTRIYHRILFMVHRLCRGCRISLPFPSNGSFFHGFNHRDNIGRHPNG